MKEQPIVSIICVTFNAEKHIKSFLESVKKYKPANCELVIFDGQSNDKTLSIISAYNTIVSKVISEKDNGIYDAMNKAVKYASGRWFYFIGADDEILSDFSNFVLQLKEIQTIYHGNILMNNEIIVRSSNAYRLAKENISHQTIFYPASVFRKYSYNQTYPICADYELNIKLRGDIAYKFQYLPLTPAKFGTYGISSSRKDKLFEKNKANIIKQYIGFYVYFRLLFKQFKLKIGNK